MGQGFETTSYIGLQAGAIQAANGNTFGNNGITAGTTFSKNGTYLKLDANLGTAIGGKVEAGHSFDIGKNMGLDLSTNAQYQYSLGDSNYIKLNSGLNTTISTSNGDIPVKSANMATIEWNPAVLSFGAAAKVSKQIGKPDNGVKISLGVEGGAYKGNNPKITYNSNANVQLPDNNLGYDQAYNEEPKMKGYITPTFGIKFQAKKFGFGADISALKQELKVSYRLGK